MWVEVFSLCGSCLLSVVFVGSKLLKKNKIWFWAIVIIGVFSLFFYFGCKTNKKLENFTVFELSTLLFFIFFYFTVMSLWAIKSSLLRCMFLVFESRDVQSL